MMAGLFWGLLLGLVIGAGGCWMLLQRLYGLIASEAEAERLKIRGEGLEAAQRIAEAGSQAHQAMVSALLSGGERR